MKIFVFFCFFISVLYASPTFVLFTEPKTATHLLIPVLESLTKKQVFWAEKFQNETQLSFSENLHLNDPDLFYFSLDRSPWTKARMEKVWDVNKERGSFFHLHAPYSPVMETYLLEKKCLNFFIKRDPRDRIVSLLNHYRNIQLNDPSLEFVQSDEERLLLMIRKNLRKSTIHFMGWLSSPVSVVLEFDKLMGAHGGVATNEDALNEMRKITRALNIAISDEALKKIYKNYFGRGWNFFKGKVNSWKDYFTEEHKRAAKEEIGDLLIELGYEKDLNW